MHSNWRECTPTPCMAAGLVEKAVALLAWQASASDSGIAQEYGSADDMPASNLLAVAPEEADDGVHHHCGSTCTVLAMACLLSVAVILALGLTVLSTFWRQFGRTCWKPATPAIRPHEVNDPLFSLWSQLKTRVGRWLHTPPPVPSSSHVKDLFSRYDRRGDGKMNASELPQALDELGLLAIDREAAQHSLRESSFTTEEQPAASAATARLSTRIRLATRAGTRARLPRLATGGVTAALARRQFAMVREYVDRAGDRRIDEKEFATILTHVQVRLMLLPPQQRVAGKWVKPPADLAEPARTERLLSAPFTIFWRHSADYLDGYSLCIFPKASGGHFLGVAFQLLVFVMQVVLGIVSGIGPYITQGTAAATAQVLSVAVIKLAWAGVLTCFSPCSCGLTNAVIAMQCFSEGLASLLLLLAAQASQRDQALTKTLCFLLLLLPVFVPILQKLYDSVIVNIIIPCYERKKLNKQLISQESVKWFLSVPSMVGQFFGVDVGSFNPARLVASVNKLIADGKQQRAVRKGVGKVKVMRVVWRKVHPSPSEGRGIDPIAAGLGLGLATSLSSPAPVGVTQKRKKTDEEEDEEAEHDDAEGGDDDGGAGGDDG